MTDEKPRRRRGVARKEVDDGFVQHFVDLLSPLGRIACARFFGGHGLKVGGVQFAMIFEGVAYVKSDEALRARLEALGGAPFSYGTKHGEVRVTSYVSIPGEQLDDEELVLECARRALALARKRREL
jgi:DNA transformation protein